MTNLIWLLRLNLDEEFGISRFRYERDKRKRWAMVAKFVMMVLFMIGTVAVFYLLGQFLVTENMSEAIPIIGYVVGSILTLVLTILKINETLMGKKDAEFLMAMPMGTFLQVLFIFLRIYVWNFLCVVLCNVPLIISYASNVDVADGFWFFWVMGLFMTPLPVGGVAALVGTILALVLAPVKNANLIHSCIKLGIFAAIGILLVVLGNGIGELTSIGTTAQEIIAFVSVNYRPGRLYQLGIVEQIIPWCFLFVFLSAIWNVFFLFVMGVAYPEVVMALRAPGVYKEYKYDVQKQTSIENAFMHRQWQQWIHSHSYMVSTLLGPILAFLTCAWIAIRGLECEANFLFAVPFFLSAFVGSGCSTYCSLSMEGRHYWIMNSIPMDLEEICRSKIKMNLFITVPMAIICGILLTIGMEPGMWMGIGFILIPVIYAYISAAWGMFIDRKFVDYSMESEDMILRQSTSFYFGYLPGVLLPLALGTFFLLY